MATFSDYTAAMKMRDLMQQVVRDEVERINPRYRYGTVVSIDTAARKCVVQYPGEAALTTVSMGIAIQPTQIGQMVRVEGYIGDRFISDVITPYNLTLPQTWHKLGDAGEPAFGAGWQNFSALETGGGWTNVKFMKDQQDWVRLTGLANRPVAGTQAIIFTLPVGYRPPIDCEFTTVANDANQVVRVNTAGQVAIISPNPSDIRFCSLFGIQFYVGVNGTFRDKMNNLNAPQFTGGVDHWIPGFGRMALMQRRDDGYVRCDGYSNFPFAPPVYIARTLPTWETRFASIFGAQTWSGVAYNYSRVDLSGGMNFLVQSGTSGASAAVNFSDLWYWDKTVDQEWTSLTLGNGWGSFGSIYAPAQYYKDREGWVYLRGLVAGGTMTLGTVLATLPVGYRPATKQMFSCYSNGVMQRLDIHNTGAMQTGTTWAQNLYVSLDQIRFQAGTAI